MKFRIQVQRLSLAGLIGLIGILLTISPALAAPEGGEAGNRRSIRPQAHQAVRMSLNDLEVEIPAGAAEQEISVETVADDLAGITKPRGFRAVGNIIRFGPHGMRFREGKELRFRLKVTGDMQNARLYYINRDKSRLEVVESRFDRKTGTLEADLQHFSDYVPGVSAGWDGNGINPFFDITHGEETVKIPDRTLSVRSTVLSLPGRGINFNLVRATTSDPPLERLRISNDWYWDLPCISGSGNQLNIPGIGTIDNGYGDKRAEGVYNLNGIHYATDVSPAEDEYPRVGLADGTSIEVDGNGIKVTDRNGNWYKYQFTTWNDDYSSYTRIDTLTDSLGRVFSFGYNRNYDLTSLAQRLKNGQYKTILTVNYFKNGESFTDALGRTTTYYRDKYEQISKIVYSNGAASEYSYSSAIGVISQQRYLAPNQTIPRRVVNYDTQVIKSGVEVQTIVNDGAKIKKYNYKWSKWGGIPYVIKETTYASPGQLIEEKDFTYYIEDYDCDKIQSVTIAHATATGVLGQPATYQYEYDNWGNITRVLDPYGTETRTAYANTNSNKNLSSYNPQYQNSYYASNFPFGWDRPITTATLVNDPIHNTTQLHQTHYQYDTKGNLLKESTVHNGGYLHTTYTYDAYGNVLTKTDPNGNRLGFEYSSEYNFAYLTRVYKPENNQTIATFGYDFDTGLKTQATDPNGNRYRYEYDAVGRLTKEWFDHSDPNLQITRTLGYDDLNNILTLRFGNDTKGWQEGKIVYDPLFGKPTTIQRKQNGTWVTQKTFAYDTIGRLLNETDGMGHTIAYAYDELDRKVKTTRPDGAVTTQAWDERTVTITDPKGNRKMMTYDLLDRLVQTQEFPDGSTPITTSYSYDTYDDPFTSKTESHLVQVTNPKNAATRYTYDNLGRLTRLDYPQDGANPLAAETYAYDSGGNLIRKTQGSKTKNLTYEFFAGYRLKTVTEPDGRTVIHTYDNNDNLLTQTVSNGVSYRYTYDVRNRATGLTATLDGRNFVFGYGYDVYGRMTGLTYPNRTSPVTYSYDELDRLQGMPGFVTGCSYDLDNKLTRMTYANGVANTYSYDANDRPTTIAAGSLLNLSYGYDPAGNITRINNDYYGYDGLNRLTWYGNSATPGSGTGTRWSYDGAGNMASKTKYQSGANMGVTSFGYDLANRLWSMGSATYTNDAFGARTAKVAGDNWTYSYDGESRLTRVAKNGATQVDCVYDGNGMRVKKVEGGKTVYYVYSGANPLLEYSATDGTYLYRIYAGKKAVAEEKGGVVKFYHKDHLGSTRVVTNAAGVKIAEYKFAPYGEKEVSTGAGSDYQFTDKATDEFSGLTYFGARFYDPECGRFVSEDPKRQGGNWYSYCFNNPVNATDPDGQWADTLIDATSLVADVKDIIDNPRDPVAWMCLATDVLCTVTPGVTGGRVTIKGIETAVKAGTKEATKGAKAATVVANGINKGTEMHHWINRATLNGKNPHALIVEAKKMGIDIVKADWNKAPVTGHKGGHTKAYYEYVNSLLEKAYDAYQKSGGKWSKEEMEETLKNIADDVADAVESGDISMYND